MAEVVETDCLLWRQHKNGEPSAPIGSIAVRVDGKQITRITSELDVIDLEEIKRRYPAVFCNQTHLVEYVFNREQGKRGGALGKVSFSTLGVEMAALAKDPTAQLVGQFSRWIGEMTVIQKQQADAIVAMQRDLGDMHKTTAETTVSTVKEMSQFAMGMQERTHMQMSQMYDTRMYEVKARLEMEARERRAAEQRLNAQPAWVRIASDPAIPWEQKQDILASAMGIDAPGGDEKGFLAKVGEKVLGMVDAAPQILPLLMGGIENDDDEPSAP